MVLLVDDHRVFAEALAGAARRRAGHQPGRSGLDTRRGEGTAARPIRPDLVLLDLALADESGYTCSSSSPTAPSPPAVDRAVRQHRAAADRAGSRGRRPRLADQDHPTERVGRRTVAGPRRAHVSRPGDTATGARPPAGRSAQATSRGRFRGPADSARARRPALPGVRDDPGRGRRALCSSPRTPCGPTSRVCCAARSSTRRWHSSPSPAHTV